MSASATGRSLPSEGWLRTRPSKAIVVEPPASSAIAVTAPSRTIRRASCVLVTPALHDFRPSTATRRIRPPPSWPTAVRGLRGRSWDVRNASSAWKTGTPPETSRGPPPIASFTPGHHGVRPMWSFTQLPTFPSSRSGRRRSPRACRIAPRAGIACPVPSGRASTRPARSLFGPTLATWERTSSRAWLRCGAAGPQVGEKSATPFVFSTGWLNSVSGRSGFEPNCQVPW